jgi:hypothetical protein
MKAFKNINSIPVFPSAKKKQYYASVFLLLCETSWRSFEVILLIFV